MKYCPFCQSEIEEKTEKCPACGKILITKLAKTLNRLALISFILAIISYPFSAVVYFLIDWLTSLGFMSDPHQFSRPLLFVIYFLITITPNIPLWTSIIFGIVALKQIRENAPIRGKGLAITGIVLGAISPLFSVISIFLLGLYFTYGF